MNGSLFGATSIAIGNAHACAVRSDGSVQCWGGGGLVGDGTTVGRFTPVSVPGLDDVVGIGVGFLHTCAVRKAGDVLCWGIGTSGQTTNSLGLQLNSPTPVSGLPRPALGIAAHEGSHTCAVLNDGTAWCWGANMTGQLGDGTITARYTPTPMKMN